MIPPDNFSLVVTKSGQAELKNRSPQTIVELDSKRASERQAARSSAPTSSLAKFDPESATPRGMIEITIGIVKRFRKISAGRVRVHDDHHFIKHLIIIACVVANMTISGEIDLKGSDAPHSD